MEGLLALRAYDEAVGVLTGLGAEADTPRATRLLQWIRAEKADYERKQRLQAEMAAATDMLREGHFQDAVKCLDALRPEFPENEELSQLYAYAQRELAAQERARAVEKIAADAGGLAADRKYDAALAALDEALKTYPGEAALIRLLGSSMAAKADWEAQQAIQAALDQCAALRTQGRFADAIPIAEAALRDYSGDTRLNEMLQTLERDLEQQRRAQAIEASLAEARKFLDQRQPEKAVQLMRQALVRYPDAATLKEMLARAQEETRALEQARAVAQVAREVDTRLGANDFSTALDVLERALKTWPQEAPLLERKQAALDAKAAWERQQAILEVTRRARRLGNEKQFVEGLALIESALQQYSDAQPLAELRQQLEGEWEEHERREAIRKGAGEARSLLADGRLEDAIRLLGDLLRTYPGEAELQLLLARGQEELRVRELAAAIEKLLAEARASTTAADFDAALRALEQGLGRYPGESALERELQTVRQAKAARQREQAIARVLQQAGQLKDSRALCRCACNCWRAPSRNTIRRRRYARLSSRSSANFRSTSGGRQSRRQPPMPAACSTRANWIRLAALNDSIAQFPGEPAFEPLLSPRPPGDGSPPARASYRAGVRGSQGLVEQRNFRRRLDPAPRAGSLPG